MQAAAVAGRLVRDKNGKWLWGYTRSLGRCSVLEAELWQILDGLDLLWKHGYRNIVVESNNAAAVKLLMNEGNARQSISVARRIRSILKPPVAMEHILVLDSTCTGTTPDIFNLCFIQKKKN